MNARGEAEVRAEVERQLRQAGIGVVVDVVDGVARLSGMVSSPRLRQLASATAGAVPGVRRVEDELAVAPPGDAETLLPVDEEGVWSWEGPPELQAGGQSDEAEEGAPGAAPYFAPTDPVVRPSRGPGGLEVVGGFSATSMDEVTADENGWPRRDDAIAEDVRRELREDALTTSLDLRVEVRGGTVILSGPVDGLEDVDAAEEVASRVPGVAAVEERLWIRTAAPRL